jgi:hypothetical protein
MSRLRAFGAFLYDFVVGDDATVAVAVVAGLAFTALVAGLGVSAWWVLPVAVVGILARTLRRAVPGPPARRASSAVHRPRPRS